MGLSLRARVRIGVAVVLVLLAAAAAVLLAATLNAGAARRDLRNLLPAGQYSRALAAHLVDQQTNERGYLITDEHPYLDAYGTSRQAAQTDTERLRQVLRRYAPDLIGRLDAADAAVERWRTTVAEPEIAARRTGVTAVRTRIAENPGVTQFAAARSAINALQADVDDGLLATEERGGRAEQIERFTELLAGAIVLGLGVATLLLVRRWVLRPVASLRRALRRVAAGDLTAAVSTHGPPEMADLGRAAEAMRRRIVSELDRARAAREALEQSGPVVVGLRAELEPSALPAGLAGLRFAAELHAAEGVLAGDWYDTIGLPGGRLGLLLTDVSGHGAQAGLVAARLKHQLTSAVRLGLPPHEALALAADGFRDEEERFASCAIIEIDPADGSGRWANAGHEPPLVVRAAGSDPCRLDPTGPLLSGLSSAGPSSWTSESFTLGPGDLLLLFTDGLVEARDAAGTEFGTDGILRVLDGLGPDPAPSVVVERTIAAARTFAQNWRRDDVTLVALARDR